MLRALLAASLLADLMSYRNCGSPIDIATNVALRVDPDPPLRGETVTLTLDYDLSAAVEGGTATYSLSLNGVPVPSRVSDLCAARSADPCPLQPGHHTDVATSVFPTDVSGKVVSRVQWANEEKEDILCVEWTVHVA
jgi:hypothetical protein